MRRLAMALLALAAGGCGARGSGDPAADGGLVVRRAALRPGTIDLIVHNGGAKAATLAQVAVDSGFVGFGGPPRAVAPHADTVLRIRYPWVPGKGYSVKLITGSGETIAYRIAPH